MSDASSNGDLANRGAVAIIGMACRLPGAPDVRAFWDNLLAGRESITTFTDEELLASGVDPARVRSSNYVKSRGIIGGADHFDASFFSFTPREAELLDPQHRVLLECAWHALEDGGYPPSKSDARVAVFGGVGTNWHLAQVSDLPEVKKHSSAASVVTGNDKDYVTTRVSYKLGLTGPSVNVQCACSTSLVAALLGMSALRTYQCDLALAGGATIEIPEKKGYVYQEGGMESPDGRCRPFDAGAKGTVFSRGSAVLLLKRLEEAIEDRDHIYAVVLDGAVNNDGSVKAGFTAPSVTGQVEAGIEALERAGVSAADLSFVEAHGTATALGDPIEVASLSQVFKQYTDRKGFCPLGSVKGNIGHTDVAAGATGVIKAALSLEHGTLPASLNFEKPNPAIDFADSALFVNSDLRKLVRANGTPLRALVNAFGVGGTNACVILQEPPNGHRNGKDRSEHVYLLSAKTQSALEAMPAALHAHLEKHPEVALGDVAYTTQVGRADFSHRRFLVASGREDLLRQLAEPGTTNQGIIKSEEPGRPVMFGFPGQGNQFLGMGRDLYRSEAVFRDAVDRCCEILLPTLDLDLRDVMYAEGETADAARRRLDETDVTQPALFVVGYAMSQLWQSWGITPDALVGHSVGEYVAGVVAGVFSLEDAVRAVARRGQLIQALPRGSMLAVLLPEDQIAAKLPTELSVAAVNGRELTVVAGPTPAIEALQAKLEERRVFAKALDTSHGFHSAMMDPALPDFAEVMAEVRLSPPGIPIVSTVTGTWLTDDEATDPQYWVRHMRLPVRFTDAATTLFAEVQGRIFLECGPGRSLTSAAKRLLDPESPHSVIGTMRAEAEGGSDLTETLRAVGAMWVAGWPIAWPALHDSALPGRVPLPGYPFERQRFALDVTSRRSVASDSVGWDDRKNPDVGEWYYLPTWKRTPLLSMLITPERPELESPSDDDCWLVLADGHGIAPAVDQALKASGKDVITVMRGAEFERTGEGYAVRPGSAEDYGALLSALKAESRNPSRVLHMWNVDASLETVALEELEAREEIAFYSPLFLEQAFIAQGMTDGLRILVAVSGAVDVAGEGILDPVAALAVGPCRALRKETPRARARFVDVDAPEGDEAREALARHLIAEVGHDRDEDVVAYRRGYRWVESHEPVVLKPGSDFGERVSPDGVYLITGGLGGLGLFVARHMAASAACTLVLTSRSGLPDRGEWSAWLEEHQESDPTSERIRAVAELEADGASVVVAGADSGDAEAMEALVADVERRFGSIRGVIHTAGVAGGGIISLKTREMVDEVLRPKVRGTLVLDRIFAEHPLDFFILFSSITGLLGEAGRVDYCAANRFMDALAEQRSKGRPWRMVAIDWPSWAGFGMAARWEETKTRRLRELARQQRTEVGRFLRLVGEEDGEEVYDVLLDPDADWVVTSHKIFGVPTLVGASFFQFLYEFAGIKQAGAAAVVDRGLFLSPLMFHDGEGRRLRLFVREAGGRHKFSFRSQRLSVGGEASPWQEHFRGEVSLGEQPEVEPGALAATRSRFDGEVDEASFLRPLEDGVTPYLELGDRWNSLEALRIGKDEWLAHLELPDEFRQDLDEWVFHPAMLDVALAAAVWRVVQAPYLPGGYDRVRLSGPFTPTLISHIQLRDFPGETVSFDVTLMDPDGRELAYIEGYTLRRVQEGGARPESVNGRPPGTPSAEDEESTDILPEEGWDAFCRIMAAPFVPKLVVSTRDLDGLIEEENETPEAKKARTEESEDVRATSYARPSLSTPYEAPTNAIEEAVAEVWQGILGIREIGINDNFTELGGNSLLAVQTVANTADTFDVDLPVDAFFRNPTIRGVAETVTELLVSMASEETLEELMATLDA